MTLAAVGVLASMTIPAIINDFNERDTIVKLKKVYSVTNNILSTLATEQCSSTSLDCIFSSTNGGVNLNKFGSLFVDKYNVQKNCGRQYNPRGWCFADYSVPGGADNPDGNTGYYKFVASDGMTIAFSGYGGCEMDYGINSDSPTAKTCGIFYVDINGLKKPNRSGHDVFLFYITSNKMPLLYPFGGEHHKDWWWKTSSDNRSCRSPFNGWGVSTYCAGRVMEEGWKITYY